MNYQLFYQIIEKPSFAPPSWVFGTAWGIIYPLIIIAGVILVYHTWRGNIPWYILGIFGLNIIANVIFTPLQLQITSLIPATIDIIVVLVTLIATMALVFPYNKVIFALLVPYVLWGGFATVLQVTIGFMNSWRLPI